MPALTCPTCGADFQAEETRIIVRQQIVESRVYSFTDGAYEAHDDGLQYYGDMTILCCNCGQEPPAEISNAIANILL